ncbi:uncharacterized protein LOC118281518 [Spodoptera frugiperda]|uniref:Uncharacterized protein LOC118281518 n=1 Tax=Spodoptera frugiperda TaxID=7108 RepID=A0A9R0DS21_SPOFR|nr:uncharacterized protein LOC118281518 [Spodoptera frugiperda]
MGLGDDTKNLAELNTRRSSVKGQVTKFRNYLEKISRFDTFTTTHRAELTLKLSKFENLSLKFDELQSQIEILNSSGLKDELQERENIEGEFISNIVMAQELLQMHSRDEGVHDSSSTHNITHCAIEHNELGFKLPLIQVSKFDGSYLKWMEFRDTFRSLVHENSRISSVNKFHYLISYLEGEAARTISNLEVSDNNYREAWNLLLERYDNKRLLITHHLNELFNINSINKESERSLRFLVDHVTKNLRALSNLGQATEHWDVLIIHLVASKVDQNTFTKWEEYRNALSTDTPTLKVFYKFLNDRANVLESLQRSKLDNAKPNHDKLRPESRLNRSDHKRHNKAYAYVSSSVPSLNQSSSHPCPCCHADHKIFDCPVFKAKSISDRISEATKLKLCLNCLRSGHPAFRCRLGRSRECNKRHNSLLHLPTDNAPSTSTNNHSETLMNCSNQASKCALLCTALVQIVNPKTGESETVRALLDCGSQSSFISVGLKQRLSLEDCSINATKVIGFGNNDAGTITEYCVAQLKSLNSSLSIISNYFVMKELTASIPNSVIDIRSFNIPKNVILADPKFYQPCFIDILIGSDLFWDIIGCEQMSLGPNHPKLHSSKLGWLIGGPLQPNQPSNNIKCNHTLTHLSSRVDLEADLNKFWELEEIPSRPYLSESEQVCESHFLQHTSRLENGRFSVKLPLIDSPDCLGDSYTMAKKRFYNLERRFRKQPDVKSQYVQFLREYEELGHLSEITINNFNFNQCNFLPHHPVFKENSESTKIRVVFDASARTSSGFSVNDIQMTGPQIQDSIFSILIRARFYKYILAADVEKLFRQILLDETDRNLQFILWREEESKPLRTLRLNTVTYGFTSASYLSTRCLWQLGEECSDPFIKTIIQHDLYVDDLITGCNSEEELKHIQKSVSQALKAGCFNLRKYKSNSSCVLEACSKGSSDTLIISESSNALGLGWNSNTDQLHYSFEIPPIGVAFTKRYILSTSFKIFDPLGFVSPCIIIPKLIMQQLWLEKVGWDEPVSVEIEEAWRKFAQNLSCLALFTVPRRVLCDSPVVTELHIFSDASQRAYGACIYVRSIDEAGTVHVNLLCSKSKVAPIKPCTIPRLELCAALLAVRLCKAVVDSLRFPIARKLFWCDSTVVLAWLHTSFRSLKTFVANRTAEILESSDVSSWRYVPTSENPADLVSRGVYPEELKDRSLWWSGPEFLLQDELFWPTLPNKLHDESEIPEIKTVMVTKLDNPSIIPFLKYSKLHNLKRDYAYALRYFYNLRNPKARRFDSLDLQELQNSFHLLCRKAQQESFPIEYDLLHKNKVISSKSPILSLTPFMDTDGLIRVGGRLDASTLPFASKHPILLHSSHHLTKLIFEREHIHKLHAGPQLLLASVRQYVWPINGRHLARSTVHNCITCRRIQGKSLSPMMGNLPSQRVTVDFPFRSVGVDFAGPFYVTSRKGRGAKVTKCYLCIFVCLRYKCVHLEAVSDLSKDAFILTLRRFISRRGKPIEIFSDNGRNFVATAKEISNFLKCNRKVITELMNEEEIKFIFTPAYAPHFGGIWEAGVKSAKFHIRRVMGNTHLTFEEISTLFAQVEAILNSRPFYLMSSSPNDLLFLTPGHFLLGRPLTALPSPSLEHCSSNQLKRYQRLEQIRQHFWRRWQNEYLAELQQRSKWRTSDTPLKVGDVVLLQEENLPPLCWRMGRISKLFPGPDGVCRVADVQTTQGCYRRPFRRLCPLPATEHLIES